MTFVTVCKFDCCSKKNALDFLTNVLKDLHSFIFSGNSFQIFGPMYLIDCFVTLFLHDDCDLRVTSSNYSGRFSLKYIVKC